MPETAYPISGESSPPLKVLVPWNYLIESFRSIVWTGNDTIYQTAKDL